ncbi:unnamed protein product, partial [Urochloa humidicola]
LSLYLLPVISSRTRWPLTPVAAASWSPACLPRLPFRPEPRPRHRFARDTRSPLLVRNQGTQRLGARWAPATERRLGPCPPQIWLERQQIHAARTKPRPPVMNSIFFRDGDRIEWPIVLAFALLRCENRRRRALIAGGAVLSSATPTRSTSSPTCATSSTCPTSPTSSPPSRLPATPRWGPEPHPPSLRQQVLRRQAKMNMGDDCETSLQVLMG